MKVIAYRSAYPGSMVECSDADYVERSDTASLLAALHECLIKQSLEISDLQAQLIDERAHYALKLRRL